MEINYPKIRFPHQENPWSTSKLESIVSWSSGGTPSKDKPEYWDGDIPWISASSMRGNRYTDSELKITPEGLVNGSKLARKGDLLLLVRGSMLFNKIPVGVAGRDVAYNQDVKAIRCTGEVISDFLLNWFYYSENKLLNMVVGTGIGAGKLDLNDLKQLDISIPSLPEQQKIASFLTAVDDKIQQLTRKKELLKQYKKGLMQQLFSQKLRFKDDDGDDFPDWEEKLLKDLAIIKYGKDQKQVAEEEGLYPILGTGGEIGRTNAYLYEKPSVLIGRKGTIDRPMFMTTPFWTVDTLFYTEIMDGVVPKFLYYSFETVNWYLYNEASGVPSLSASTIYKVKFVVPSRMEQAKIANFLSAIDDKINSVSQQIEHTRQFKKGLLQRLLI